jgi:hypothetical protein
LRPLLSLLPFLGRVFMAPPRSTPVPVRVQAGVLRPVPGRRPQIILPKPLGLPPELAFTMGGR